MAENKRYFWLKLHEDFFGSKRIKKLRKLGADYVIIYLKLQLMSLNNGGVIEYTGIEDTLAKELELEIDEDADKIQLTLSYLQSCGLLTTNDDNDFFLPYVDFLTGSETASTVRSRKSRASKVLHCNNNATLLQQDATKCNGEIEIEKDIDIRDKNTSYKDVVAAYHEICISYPKVRRINGAREKAIKARLNEYSFDELKELFQKAEQSLFLKGKNQRNWRADFDWLMNANNIPKVLEGKYDDSSAPKEQVPKGNKFNNFQQRNYDYAELERKLLNNE